MTKKIFEVTNGRFLNMHGRNIYKGYNIKSMTRQKKEFTKEVTGYGVSKSSEEIDKLEKDPMNKLKEKLSKIDIKF